MEIPEDLGARIATFEKLGRWDRAELGRSLRCLGLSYGEIMEIIPVPKGTLAGWCRDIRLSTDQIAAIKERCGPAVGPRDTQWRRRLEVEAIRSDARVFALEHLTDAFWMAGTVLYWGEGAKTKRSFSVANSDASALRLFMHWTRRYVEEHPVFVLKLNLHANNDEALARDFWRHSLGAEAAEFYRTFIKPDGTGHRKNHLPHGVCEVRMRRPANAAIKVATWIEVVASRLGLEETPTC
ncbi:MAG: hypothetical protein KJP22_07915 [Acidimicrobiia bacterium]|nr:hypothetical protein [Acidimicrobiia bacterium]MBT8193312.1 hypothetical protein [Acidimicrobiia bacterium]NNF86976.1 hypothetical protein [Acidimicrobiia bacterium]NNL12544.1 hypothetical protein [Acidimicrobiia bacterium]NNL69613.1 hypothetical protein [Acidimicrobiia bacterium]